jgi:hypothetical protein
MHVFKWVDDCFLGNRIYAPSTYLFDHDWLWWNGSALYLSHPAFLQESTFQPAISMSLVRRGPSSLHVTASASFSHYRIAEHDRPCNNETVCHYHSLHVLRLETSLPTTCRLSSVSTGCLRDVIEESDRGPHGSPSFPKTSF